MDNTQEIDTNAEQLSSEQKRLFDVLTLIENVCKQETPTPSVEEHKGFVGWESDLRGLPGIVFNLDNEGDPIWMEVRRLVPTPSPARSESRNPWVEKSDDPNKEPKVLSQIVIQVPWSESKAYASKIAAAEDVVFSLVRPQAPPKGSSRATGKKDKISHRETRSGYREPCLQIL